MRIGFVTSDSHSRTLVCFSLSILIHLRKLIKWFLQFIKHLINIRPWCCYLPSLRTPYNNTNHTRLMNRTKCNVPFGLSSPENILASIRTKITSWSGYTSYISPRSPYRKANQKKMCTSATSSGWDTAKCTITELLLIIGFFRRRLGLRRITRKTLLASCWLFLDARSRRREGTKVRGTETEIPTHLIPYRNAVRHIRGSGGFEHFLSYILSTDEI